MLDDVVALLSSFCVAFASSTLGFVADSCLAVMRATIRIRTLMAVYTFSEGKGKERVEARGMIVYVENGEL